MSSIDERVVRMKFLNSDFEKGIKQSTDSLSNLKSSLKLDNASNSLQRLKEAGNRFSLSNISNQLTDISSKFSALGAAGVVALGNIATQAINTGVQLLKSLTVDPIKAGLAEYELKMGSIQTILANTSKYGTTLSDVNTALDKLNEYSDKTIYNFGQMTKNIGLFTNAGIKLEDAVSMIKGFSNAAAASGVTAENAAGAAYQLSQALSSGTVRLMDWKSLTNAGMGSANMKQGLVDIGNAMGTLGKLTPTGIMDNFNGSLQSGWLSAEVMSTYLRIIAGDMTDVEMKSLGLSDALIKDLKAQQKTAEEAATKVRTYTQLINTMREAVGSSWAETFSIVIGNFDEATTLFTDANNAFSKIITASGDARNNLLNGWKDLGGRTLLIKGITNIFEALGNVLKTIGDAFKQVFPPTTAKQLFSITESFAKFTEMLKTGSTKLTDLKRTLRGVFAIFGIVWEIVKAFTKALFSLFGASDKGAGGLLKFTGNIGDFIYGIQQALKEGTGLSKFFGGIAEIVKVPIAIVTAFITVLNGLFSGLSAANDGIASKTTRLKETLNPIQSIGNAISNIWEKIVTVFKKAGEFFKPLTDAISKMFDGLPDIIKNGFNKVSYDSVFDAFNTGLLAGLVVLVAKIFNNGLFFGKINGFFKNLSGTLKSFQDSLKAKTLLTIALAVATLAAAAIALSLVDSKKLAVSLAAIGVLFTQLLAGLALFTKVSTSWTKLPFLSLALINLAIAINILVTAVVRIAKLDWQGLAKGLIGLTVLLGLMVVVSRTLNSNAKGLISAGIAIGILATGIKILASSVIDLSKLSWENLSKGVLGLTAILGLITVFSKLNQANASLIGVSFGMVLLAISIKIFASAIIDLSKISWENLGKGLSAMAAALAIVAGALWILPTNIVGTAFGLVLVATALVIMAKALSMFGNMTWDEIGRGLTVMAASLAILAGALYLMSGALPGAFALLIAASALAILAIPLKILGSMSWSEIGQGLGFLAGALAIIAAAGYLLIGALPGLLGLGAAVLLVGLGTLAAGIGISLLSLAIAALVVSLTAGAAVLIAFVTSIIKLIPFLAVMLAKGIIEIVKVIGESGSVILSTLVVLLMTLITAVKVVIPPLIKVIFDLIWLILSTLEQNLPRFIRAGANILIALLNGIAKKLPDIINAGTNLLISFLKGLQKAFPRVADAAFKTVIAFIDGLTAAIKENAGKLRDAGAALAFEIIDGITFGIAGHAKNVFNGAVDLGNEAIDGIKSALGIKSPSKEFYKIGEYSAQGLANGLNKTSYVVKQSAENVGNSAINSLNNSISKISEIALSNIDMNPTIRPVLDLSAIKKDSSLIESMLKPSTISVDSAYAQASSIAVQQRANQAQQSVSSQETITNSDTNITFIQNNNSPKALSASEIYRQTKNQISAAKLITAV